MKQKKRDPTVHYSRQSYHHVYVKSETCSIWIVVNRTSICELDNQGKWSNQIAEPSYQE